MNWDIHGIDTAFYNCRKAIIETALFGFVGFILLYKRYPKFAASLYPKNDKSLYLFFDKNQSPKIEKECI